MVSLPPSCPKYGGGGAHLPERYFSLSGGGSSCAFRSGIAARPKRIRCGFDISCFGIFSKYDGIFSKYDGLSSKYACFCFQSRRYGSGNGSGKRIGRAADDVGKSFSGANGGSGKTGAQASAFTRFDAEKLDETVFLTKLAEDGCHDVKTEVAARTEGNPDLTFRAQQILARQGKLQYDENCSDAWNFCAMGFLNMGELGDYPASEMYNRLMQQPDCEMQDYPLSVLAGIGHIRCSEGFASEQRLRVLHLVGLLEQGNKPVRWLQYPDLCYKAVSGLSVSLATGGVCRSGMQNEGIAKEFSAVFSRLLHIYSRDTETGVIPRTETDAEIPSVSKCLGLLLEAQCGRREKDADFVADIAVNYWLLRQSDLLALTFDYAASRNVLDKIVDENRG